MRRRLQLSAFHRVVHNVQLRTQILRNIAARVSRVKRSTKPVARSWACLHWKTGGVRSLLLTSGHSNRYAACARRKRLTGVVAQKHCELKPQLTKPGLDPRLSSRSGPFLRSVDSPAFLTAPVLDFRMAGSAGSDGFNLRRLMDFLRRR